MKHHPTDDMSREKAERLARMAVVEWVEEDWEEKWERERGILSDLDRRFLWDIHEYDTPQQTSARKRTIRNRVEDGMLDLFYLSHLPEEQREKIFDELEEAEQIPELRSAIAELVKFLYLGLDGDVAWLEGAISQGVANAEQERHETEPTYYAGPGTEAGVNVDIEVSEGFDVDQLENQLHSPYAQTLTPAEIGVLVREGVIEGEEDLAAVRYSMFPDKEEGEREGSENGE